MAYPESDPHELVEDEDEDEQEVQLDFNRLRVSARPDFTIDQPVSPTGVRGGLQGLGAQPIGPAAPQAPAAVSLPDEPWPMTLPSSQQAMLTTFQQWVHTCQAWGRQPGAVPPSAWGKLLLTVGGESAPATPPSPARDQAEQAEAAEQAGQQQQQQQLAAAVAAPQQQLLRVSPADVQMAPAGVSGSAFNRGVLPEFMQPLLLPAIKEYGLVLRLLASALGQDQGAAAQAPLLLTNDVGHNTAEAVLQYYGSLRWYLRGPLGLLTHTTWGSQAKDDVRIPMDPQTNARIPAPFDAAPEERPADFDALHKSGAFYLKAAPEAFVCVLLEAVNNRECYPPALCRFPPDHVEGLFSPARCACLAHSLGLLWFWLHAPHTAGAALDPSAACVCMHAWVSARVACAPHAA